MQNNWLTTKPSKRSTQNSSMVWWSSDINKSSAFHTRNLTSAILQQQQQQQHKILVQITINKEMLSLKMYVKKKTKTTLKHNKRKKHSLHYTNKRLKSSYT